MYELNLESFWNADEEAHKNNCFNSDATQIAMGIRMSEECVYAELGEPGNPWGNEERDRRMDLNKRYNDKAEKIVGQRLLREYVPTEEETFPEIKRIGEVFGGTYSFLPEAGMWLSSPIDSYKELETTLDQVDHMDLATFMLPNNWHLQKKRIFEEFGHKPYLLRGVRGPVTLATSLVGEDTLIFMYYDAPELFRRFSNTIGNVIVEMAEIMDAEAGFTNNDAPGGFSFYDDNCCLLNPEMYEAFGYPVLQKVFDRFSPEVSDKRFQHSDSEMAHLLPTLARLNLTGVNFGPTLTVEEIRYHMPNTRIDGQLAPFTFMNNDKDAIITEIKRDCHMAKEQRGLNISTAGSINNGSSLESMRTVMWAITEFGQY